MIRINDVEINKQEILHFVNSGKLIQAIKNIIDKTGIGLKDCKEIVDNLVLNPNYYDGQTIQKTTVASFNNKFHKTKRRKGSHVIIDKSSRKKNNIIVTLVILIIILVYMYVSVV